jgi:4-hydroxyphenylpyruvate dioxygenase
MRTADDAVCIALNSTRAERTVARKLMQRQAGGGVQHIALQTADIFAVARRLDEEAVKTLKLPQNYYDDLGARFGLDDDTLAEMAALGLLYDEDQHGSFHQLYTAHFHGRFCFEIVQRNGYRGFGAANTPVRSAMQAAELG